MYKVENRKKWKLVHKSTEKEVTAGDKLETFRMEKYYYKNGVPPHKPSSQGFVNVVSKKEEVKTASSVTSTTYYPSVFGLKWKYERKEVKNDN